MQSQLILTTLAQNLVKFVPSTVFVDCDIHRCPKTFCQNVKCCCHCSQYNCLELIVIVIGVRNTGLDCVHHH